MEENKIGNISSLTTNSNYGIKSLNSPFAQAFYFVDIYSENEVKSFIKKTEKLIRISKEYSHYIELLRTNVNSLNSDSVLGNITTGDTKTFEFHHYPFTLYELIESVMTHNVLNSISFNTFSIAKEVLEEHYKHHVGLVSLTHTMHELAHSGNIFISKEQVFGDYHKFMEKYSDGISAEIKSKIASMENLSDSGMATDYKGLFV